MPGIIDALADFRVPFSILTKGPLIRRDLDRLAAASRVTTVHLGMSISIMDEELQQSVERGTATARARLAAVTAIRAAGLDCTVFLSPILPLLSDSPGQLAELVGAVAAAGATSVLFHTLYLPTGVREVFFAWLREAYPQLVPDYTALYAPNSARLRAYHQETGPRIRALIAKHGLPDPDKATEDKFALNGRRGQQASEPAQQALF
jgi:DNA repair photolyase